MKQLKELKYSNDTLMETRTLLQLVENILKVVDHILSTQLKGTIECHQSTTLQSSSGKLETIFTK